MTVFVGPLGNLFPTRALAGLQVVPYQREQWHEGIDGSPSVTVIGQEWRTWAPSIPLTDPARVASLRVLAAEQDDAWWLLTESAQHGNVLPPRASRWHGWGVSDWTDPTIPPEVHRGGNVLVDDEIAPVAPLSAVFDAAGTKWFSSPLFPVPTDGRPCTASTFLLPGHGHTEAQLRILWTNGSGTPLAGPYPTAGATKVTTPLERVVVTAVPPAGAVAARLEVRQLVQAANPALTWTPVVMPWTEGQGAARVRLGRPIETVVVTHTGQRLSAFTYTAREVRA